MGQSKRESHQIPGRHITQVQSQTVTTHPPGPLRVQALISEIETVQSATCLTQALSSPPQLPTKCANLKLLEESIS